MRGAYGRSNEALDLMFRCRRDFVPAGEKKCVRRNKGFSGTGGAEWLRRYAV